MSKSRVRSLLLRASLLVGVFTLSGCVLNLPFSRLRPRTPAADAPPAETPAPPPPAPTPPPTRKGPTSDEVWLVEMMAQRLELTAAEAWSLPANPETENLLVQARLHALEEQAARVGLPAEPSARFFEAQVTAAAARREELRKLWRNPTNRPVAAAVDPRQIAARLDAVDLQILATFRRLGGIPFGSALHRYARETLRARGFSKPVTNIATAPLAPASNPG